MKGKRLKKKIISYRPSREIVEGTNTWNFFSSTNNMIRKKIRGNHTTALKCIVKDSVCGG